jgi:hypothetical protein
MKLSNKKKPKVLFSIVTCNEEKRIIKCIDAIKKLDYPKDRYEIVVADANSRDNTINILKKRNIKIVENIYKFPEPGHVLNYYENKFDYFVFVAADNIILGKDWLENILKVFKENNNVSFITPLVKITKNDTLISNFLNYDTDPFNSFFYLNGSNPRFFDLKYKVLKETSDYKIYEYKDKHPPLIALAQCTVVSKEKFKIINKKLNAQDLKNIDDLEAVWITIKKYRNFAVSKNSFIMHTSLKNLSDFYEKFNNRIKFSIKSKSFENRQKYYAFSYQIRKYFFLILSVVPLYQIIISTYRYVTTREKFHFYYPITALLIAYLIIKNYIVLNVINKKR